MPIKLFKGGVHPDDGKALAKDRPLQRLTPGPEVTVPVSMHIGAPAKPIVKKGDTVLRGQLIAESGGFVSAPVHASVSGTIKSIEMRETATGGRCNMIVIENDGLYTEVTYPEKKPFTEQTHEEILSAIRDAGVVGMGGAGFPTHVKLSPPKPEKIDHIIANCAECEPYITVDYRRMLESPEKIVNGMRIVLQLFPEAKGVFGIEDNKPECIKKLKALTKDEPRMSVDVLRTRYPQGAERQLIYAVTGRAINSDMLPADAGCIVDNVETLIAIHEAVTEGKPVMERTITVSGDAVMAPGNFIAPVGMNHAEILHAAGGFRCDPEKLISGGPMMGFAMCTIDVPMTKTTSSFLAFEKDPVTINETTACIKCGRCVNACPSRIVPVRVMVFAENNVADLFVKWDGLECCGCGCCSYVCPANRPLKQVINDMRNKVLADKKAKIAAEKAAAAKKAEEVLQKKEEK